MARGWSVGLLVPGENRALPETLPTVSAVVWLFTSVDTKMNTELGWVIKALPTFWAVVQFSPRVLVDTEHGWVGKGPPTISTGAWHPLGMEALVGLELGCAWQVLPTGAQG